MARAADMALFGLSGLVAATAFAYDAATAVSASRGDLPLILTVPHDGALAPGNVPARMRGMVTRDIGTAPLAEHIAKRLEVQLGKRPYVVIARFERRYVDVNRDEHEALDSPAMLPAYRAYHEQVAAYVAEIRKRFPAGTLLVDIHGQSQEPATIFRGTRAGLTTQVLVRRAGTAAIQGEQSIIGLLAANGYRVHPAPGAASLREDPRFAGGFTVFQYGSHNAGGIDAIQLEFGKTYRDDPNLAGHLANALTVFMREHGMLQR